MKMFKRPYRKGAYVVPDGVATYVRVCVTIALREIIPYFPLYPLHVSQLS